MGIRLRRETSVRRTVGEPAEGSVPTMSITDGSSPAALAQVLEYASGCRAAVEDLLPLALPAEIRAQLEVVEAELSRTIALTRWRLGVGTEWL